MALRNTVVVYAPVGRDAALMVQSLDRAGVSAAMIDGFEQILAICRSGDVGALLLTAEALSAANLKALVQVLSAQPEWSDLPVLILVPGGRESSVIHRMEQTLSPLPNLTLLERPIRPVTLASVARNALRSRYRQYEVQRVMDEREQAANAMIQSEKLAAVGRMASTIAHEINNPLEAITNLLYLIRGETGLTQAGRDYLETADRELARVSQIASQTLRFHRQSTAAVSVRPEALLEEVLGIYKSRLANSQITIACEFAPDTRVACYEGDIRQVLSNLVGNAFDVMRRGGNLRLRTRKATWWRTGVPGVVFTICDDGPGMEEQTRRHIFEAFYSTKGINGTGLGLWISRRIVQKHSGHLIVRSRTGDRHGTVFQLWLPADLVASSDDVWHADELRA